MIFLKKSKLFLYVNTLKYLKFTQIFYKIYYIVNPRIYFRFKKVPLVNSSHIFIDFPFKQATTIDYDSFIFLAQSYKLSKVGWDNKNLSKLWKYNLHYFDYINSELSYNETNLIKINLLINKWINENPIGKGVGWEPYPTSMRIINWIKWHWKTQSLSKEAIESIWLQTNWLKKNIEFHLLGNHVFVNAKALIFSGFFFNGKESTYVLNKGERLIKREIEEQFLTDGGHFELSPMYHSLCLEDMLDLLNISSNHTLSINTLLSKKIENGLNWLEHFSYRNLELANFNDCTNRISLDFNTLEKYSNKLNIFLNKNNKNQNLFFLKDSGFVIFSNEQLKVLADVGDIGAKYIPGHAHADTLSFELSIFDNRVIVNSGISTYEKNLERHIQRSTISHSTVEINNENSSEVWSGFRVANRAKIFDLLISNNSATSTYFCATHNGYDEIIHKRTWDIRDKIIMIEDQIIGNFKNAISRLYLHPDISHSYSDNVIVLYSKNMVLCKIYAKDSKGNSLNINIIDSLFHIEFGVSITNKLLSFDFVNTNKIVTYIEIV